MIASLFSFAACSLTGTDTQDCSTNQECVQSFGFGSTCSSEGFCAQQEPNIRCTKTFPEDIFLEPESYKDAFIMGSLMDQSLATHRARENSIRLAIEQFNSSQRIDNRTIGAVFCSIQEDVRFDELARQDAALESARYLIDDLTIPAIIGPSSSDDYIHVSTELNNESTLFVSPAATSVELSNLDVGPFTDEAPGIHWQVAPPDSFQATAIAEDMRSPGSGRMNAVNSVQIIHKDDSYGNPLASEFAAAFTANGGTTPGFLPFEDNNQLLTQINTAVNNVNLEEILFVSSQVSDLILFINAMEQITAFTGNIFLTDSAANADVLQEISGALASRIRGTRPAPRNSGANPALTTPIDTNFALFVSRYLNQFGEDVEQFSFTAHSFDAAFMVSSAFAWAHFNEDEINGQTMAKGLRQISSGNESEPIQWSSIVNSFEQGNPVDLVGVSGDIDFNETTELTVSPIEIWEVDDDEVSRIYDWNPPAQSAL